MLSSPMKTLPPSQNRPLQTAGPKSSPTLPGSPRTWVGADGAHAPLWRQGVANWKKHVFWGLNLLALFVSDVSSSLSAISHSILAIKSFSLVDRANSESPSLFRFMNSSQKENISYTSTYNLMAAETLACDMLAPASVHELPAVSYHHPNRTRQILLPSSSSWPWMSESHEPQKMDGRRVRLDQESTCLEKIEQV